MRGKNLLVLILCCLTTILVSCDYEEPYSRYEYRESRISVYPSTITLKKDAFEGDFDISSSKSWRIESYPTWVHLSTLTGDFYRDEVHFTVDENPDSKDRSGYIEIVTQSAFQKKDYVRIVQPPSTTFDYYFDTYFSSSNGANNNLRIYAAQSKAWTIKKPASDSWVHIGARWGSSSFYEGSGNGEVTIFVDANPYTFARYSSLTLTCGAQSKTWTITQSGRY